MKIKSLVLVLVMAVTVFSCVPAKKFQALTDKYGKLNTELVAAQMETKACRDEKAEAER